MGEGTIPATMRHLPHRQRLLIIRLLPAPGTAGSAVIIIPLDLGITGTQETGLDGRMWAHTGWRLVITAAGTIADTGADKRGTYAVGDGCGSSIHSMIHHQTSVLHHLYAGSG
jgi:hypothetical protein